MERYDRAAKDLRDTVDTQNVTAAAEELRDIVEKEPALADVCHGLSHEIGEEALGKVGLEEGLRIEDDVCGSGITHGVIESYLKDVKDLDNALKTLCPPGSPKCVHGIGHGLMMRSDNDLPWSLKLCESFATRADQIQCAEGVFMENAGAGGSGHFSRFLREDDPYYPCRNRGDVNEAVCAFYMPRYFLRLHPRDYKGLIAYCETIDQTPRASCYKGVGSAAMKQNILDPLFAEAVCADVEDSGKQYCIGGLASYFAVHYASGSKTATMCQTLREENQETCLHIASESSQVYPD